MPVDYSGPPVSPSENHTPTPSRPPVKVPPWVLGLIGLFLVVGLFFFLRPGISSSGSFSASGETQDNSFITPTAAPTPTPIPVVAQDGCLPQIIGRQTVAQACVSNPTPRQYASVTVYARLIVDGQIVPGIRMDAGWDFKYLDTTCRGLAYSSKGVTSCTIDIENATKDYTVMIDVKLTSNGNIYNTTTSFTTEPEAIVQPVASPTKVALPAQVAQAKSTPIPIPPTATPVPAKPALNPQVELPCIGLEKFSLTYGAYRDNLGQKACLEGIISSAGARIPAGAVHITFTGYADIEGIIPADLRVRFDKNFIEKLRNKKVRLHGTFGLSSLVKVPILTVELPEQIEVLP
jgi:hypothetical protein